LESTQPTGSNDELSVRTELVGGVGKYGRLLGWLYIGDDSVSLNEQMIEEGYAHAYDGGTKDMNLELLREIRRAHGTLVNLEALREIRRAHGTLVE
jgi:micrococcal nuclease